MDTLNGIKCPYCNQPAKIDSYVKGKIKGSGISTIVFCDNDECEIKPCTDSTRASWAIADAKAWR